MKLAEAKLEAAVSEAQSAQMANLPHRLYGCQLGHDGASWIAKITCPDGTTLVGRGDSPITAITDFDAQWLGIK